MCARRGPAALSGKTCSRRRSLRPLCLNFYAPHPVSALQSHLYWLPRQERCRSGPTLQPARPVHSTCVFLELRPAECVPWQTPDVKKLNSAVFPCRELVTTRIARRSMVEDRKPHAISDQERKEIRSRRRLPQRYEHYSSAAQT